MTGHQPQVHDPAAPGSGGGSVPASRPREPAPVYYRLPDTPDGHHIKEYPSGLRILVRFVGVEEQVVKYTI